MNSKKEFWSHIPYVNCPETGCSYQTKVRRSLIAHLIFVHHYSPFAKARDKADSTGIYVPVMYRR